MGTTGRGSSTGFWGSWDSDSEGDDVTDSPSWPSGLEGSELPLSPASGGEEVEGPDSSGLPSAGLDETGSLPIGSSGA